MLRGSFYKRIQVSFLAFILAPILAVSVLSFQVTKTAMMEKIRLTNQSVLDLMAKDITELIDDLSYTTHYFARDPVVREQLRPFPDTVGIDDYSGYRRYMQIQEIFEGIAMKSVNKDIRMYLANGHGFIVPYMDITGSTGSGTEQMRRDYESVRGRISPGVSDGLQWLGSVEDGGASGSPGYYYMCRVIRSDTPSGQELGTLMVGISPAYFERLFEPFSQGAFALFGADGTRVAGTSTLPYAAELAGGDEVRNETILPKGGWKLVYETPKESITGQISQTFFWSALLICLFSAIFLLLSVFLARRLHLPVKRLQALAKQYGQGNRKVRYQAAGMDEIGELGGAVNGMLDDIDKLIESIEEEQNQKRVLELQALYAQIRPHFLLNTLNSVRCSLVVEGDSRHGGQIESLMSLLRAYMKAGELATLRSETTLLRHYTEIMEMRSDRKIRLDIAVPEELEAYPMPMLALQPLVENAVVHGLADLDWEARIEVAAVREGERVEIRVRDNGTGVTPERLQELNGLLGSGTGDQPGSYERVGLYNVLRRLRLTFGEGVSMRVGLPAAGGLEVIIRLPGAAGSPAVERAGDRGSFPSVRDKRRRNGTGYAQSTAD
ncbi:MULTISPECIES: sensor histidine kinase [Paenibacillus]|uniref:sensor histidine kinase n=1 Tax=Paenibacillus TaxID=44249 RepID=UPI0022B8E4BD|nr:sensor histidine kinase [Paenibacillus caseinilyticus]MCZ8520469.1 sensor histidine kinase [Paenibacillus caseinilyticus]